MIGFGSYHYKYTSGHEGDAMITGFSPRKAKNSLYFSTSESVRENLLKRLGKHTADKKIKQIITYLKDCDVTVELNMFQKLVYIQLQQKQRNSNRK